ncbi:MAG TPA: hypothetical protein VFP59_14775 [Candidatus Angelobacter sp.]|nr:hypothetical protein [Candidatus Angelobacter sp.]
MAPSIDHAPSELFEGGYYSIIDGESFVVVRVLKLDPEIVHVRICKEHFPQRPRSVDPARLTLGSVYDSDGFGMGHVPLRLATFCDREPLFITHAEVKPDEVEGYEMWRDADGDGGVWE